MFERSHGGSGTVHGSRGKTCECVFLTCFPSEFEFLATLVRYSSVQLYHAKTITEADFLLAVSGARVLLCDTVFPDGNWEDCAYMLARAHREVSLLVLAEEVDLPFVSGAVDRGACALSWKPITPQIRHLIVAADEAAARRTEKLGCLR